ncbi:MAG: multifunctional CCA addition/repair protein [Pseudomonadota bacterium]
MEVFLVGGWVRDQLLGYPSAERDWVVVGATPQDLLDNGYQQVGKDFPVFLHPETKEEYALARTERKQGHGYTGFDIDCDPSVTLEQDLLRRDLTVNAMARANNGKLIDPYGGQRDLEAKVLRHISDAFVEDPLRVLRTARFAARYAHLGFTIAPDTLALMRSLVQQNELAYLPAERIWRELASAMQERSPEVFIEVLRECGALASLIPEIDALFGVPQPGEHYLEVDTGRHTLLTLRQAAALTDKPEVRFSILLQDLGKGTTPAEEWPQHLAYERRGLQLVKTVCLRLRAPVTFRDLAMIVCEYHTLCHHALELPGKTLLKLLHGTDGLRKPERFEDFLLACEADARGRQGLVQPTYPQADYMRRALSVAQDVSAADCEGQDIQGKALGKAIEAERVRRLDALRLASGV